MGISTKDTFITGGVTPICNECGISLCYDISEEEYNEYPEFWDGWICKDCNGGESLSLKSWIKNKPIYLERLNKNN